MECRELAPVPSRVGFALQYRKNRLTSPLTTMLLWPRLRVGHSAQLEKDCASETWAVESDIVMSLATHRWRICRAESLFLWKTVIAPLRKGCFLKSQAIGGHKMTRVPWKHLAISAFHSGQDSSRLDSNVVLEKLHGGYFQDTLLEHTYLDERF